VKSVERVAYLTHRGVFMWLLLLRTLAADNGAHRGKRKHTKEISVEQQQLRFVFGRLVPFESQTCHCLSFPKFS
jgi:hypothetical protein